MKSRFVHLALIVLGAAGIVLSLLAQIPKYAGAAGAFMLLVADAKKALGAIDTTKSAATVFVLLLLGHALFGCATVGTAAKSCEPSTDQTAAILNAAANPARAAALAAIDALHFSLCVLQAGADKAIADLEAKSRARAEMATMAGIDPPAPDPRLGNLKAWRAAHP